MRDFFEKPLVARVDRQPSSLSSVQAGRSPAWPITKLLWAVTLFVLANSASAEFVFNNGFEPLQVISHEVVIAPGAVLMTQAGQTTQLIASVVSSSGRVQAGEIFYRSTNTAVATVTSDGQVTATGMGSAQVVAESSGALPASILITVATPVQNAVLVDDDAVVEMPEPIDFEATYGLGYAYLVTLDNSVSAEVGQIVLGTGGMPVGGRVTALETVSSGKRFTLEVVALDEMFEELVINEKFDLRRAPMILNDELLEVFDATRLENGAFVLSPKPGESRGSAVGTAITQFLDCSESTVTNPLQIFTLSSGADINIHPALSVELEYDSRSDYLYVAGSGSVTTSVELRPRTTAAFEGKIVCKLQAGEVPLPIGGPASVILSSGLAFGAGVEVGGKITLTEQVGYDLLAIGSHSIGAELECDDGCSLEGEVSVNFSGGVGAILPPAIPDAANLQLELNGFLFVFADLTFGSPLRRLPLLTSLLGSLGFKAISAKAGIKQSGNFRSKESQANDAMYASEFKLEATANVGPAADIIQFLQMLGLLPPSDQLFSTSTVLSQSPRGSFVITDPHGGSSATPNNPAVITPGSESSVGEMATFTVTLNPTTFLDTYAVEQVELYRLDAGTLVPAAPGCNTMTATAGQSIFQCQAGFTEVGDYSFYAYVKASLLGVSIPFLLEVANNSKAGLKVQNPPPPVAGTYYAELNLYALGEQNITTSFSEQSATQANVNHQESNSASSVNVSISAGNSGISVNVASDTADPPVGVAGLALADFEGKVSPAPGSTITLSLDISASGTISATQIDARNSICVSGYVRGDEFKDFVGCYEICVPGMLAHCRDTTGDFIGYGGGALRLDLGTVSEPGEISLFASINFREDTTGTITMDLITETF